MFKPILKDHREVWPLREQQKTNTVQQSFCEKGFLFVVNALPLLMASF